MPVQIARADYVAMFGPTTGDKVFEPSHVRNLRRAQPGPQIV